MAKVTLTSLDQKLDLFMASVNEQLHAINYSLNGNGTPGLKTRVELAEQRLSQQDQIETGRKINLRALWITVLTAILAIAAKVVAG